MKKAFFVIIFLFLFLMPVFGACYYLPRYTDSVKELGIGTCFVPQNITIYSNPTLSSKIVDKIQWDNASNVYSEKNGEIYPKNFFTLFIPNRNAAMVTVTEETDDWLEICYDQKNNGQGWIKKTDDTKFMSWYQFMKEYGKKYGIYFFADVPIEKKSLYSSPNGKSLPKGNEFYHPSNIQLKVISGNWALVKVVDFDNESAPIGWIKWRDENGKMYIFPNIIDQYN